MACKHNAEITSQIPPEETIGIMNIIYARDNYPPGSAIISAFQLARGIHPMRRRRWTNIETIFVLCIVFARFIYLFFNPSSPEIFLYKSSDQRFFLI